MKDRDIVVFSGSAHTELAEEICTHLGVPLSKVDIRRFSNDCIQTQLLANCRRRDVYIIQPLVPPTQENLMELLTRLKDCGCVQASVATTHGLFTGKAVERLRNHPMVDEVVTTNTVPRPADWPELEMRSVAGLFADAIARTHEGKSVSKLFRGVDPSYAPPPEPDGLF